ncbi:Ig-like domain-containing protein, partial [Stenotrophomonas sp.]|uniref:Ig-like domain-containing protein n=1 Tax=Stenotrophomonas sp. TaxID=69392 RepID=UPI0028B0626B
MTVSVSVVRGKSIQSSRKLPGASDGKVVRIAAIAEGQYLLTEQDTGVGPENITVKRVGSDLHVALQGTEPDQPELIIEGFFDLPGQLIGLAEDGAYYGYIAVDGEADHEAAFLLEEMSSPLALGYPSVVGFGDGLVAAASVLPGALLGLGALVAGALIDHNRDSGGRVPEVPMPANNGIGSVVDDQGPVVGPLASGDVTDDARPTFSGGGQRPGEKVVIRDGGSVIGDAIVDANGNWSFTPDKPLREGEHILSTVVIDQNGTHSPESEGFVVTVDTTAPASGGVSGAVDNKGTITGPIGNGGVTDDDQPTLSGVGTPGDTISIIDNGEVIGEVVVDEEGSWTFTPEQPLAEGEHVFEVVVTDPAGNSSDPSEEFVVVIDTTPPSAGAVGSIEDNKGAITGPIGNGGVTDDDQPTLSG